MWLSHETIVFQACSHMICNRCTYPDYVTSDFDFVHCSPGWRVSSSCQSWIFSSNETIFDILSFSCNKQNRTTEQNRTEDRTARRGPRSANMIQCKNEETLEQLLLSFYTLMISKHTNHTLANKFPLISSSIKKHMLSPSMKKFMLSASRWTIITCRLLAAWYKGSLAADADITERLERAGCSRRRIHKSFRGRSWRRQSKVPKLLDPLQYAILSHG